MACVGELSEALLSHSAIDEVALWRQGALRAEEWLTPAVAQIDDLGGAVVAACQRTTPAPDVDVLSAHRRARADRHEDVPVGSQVQPPPGDDAVTRPPRPW